MPVKIISVKNPYVLDFVDGRTDKLPALTKKNAEFIDAIVNLDSTYAKDLVVNKPSAGYDPIKNLTKSDGKYYGSTAYWFEEMKKPNCDFQKCVLGAIIAIDNVNSTHLEASDSGRETLCRIICSKCNSCSELIENLNIPFSADKPNHLISLLSAKTIAKKDNGSRFNLSFATKFCAYASIFLGTKIIYSKYDNVVSVSLPKYALVYLNQKKNARDYKINAYQTKNMNESQLHKYRLEVYEKYSNDIGKILDLLKKEGIDLSREEFDHIVWYSSK